jgi:hypothetical protein
MTLPAELIERAVALAHRSEECETAKEALKGAKVALAEAELRLIDEASQAEDEAVRVIARAILECRSQIAELIDAADGGRTVLAAEVRSCEESLFRVASEGGDARLAHGQLQDAKSSLAERIDEIKSIQKAERAQLRALRSKFKGVF